LFESQDDIETQEFYSENDFLSFILNTSHPFLQSLHLDLSNAIARTAIPISNPQLRSFTPKDSLRLHTTLRFRATSDLALSTFAFSPSIVFRASPEFARTIAFADSKFLHTAPLSTTSVFTLSASFWARASPSRSPLPTESRAAGRVTISLSDVETVTQSVSFVWSIDESKSETLVASVVEIDSQVIVLSNAVVSYTTVITEHVMVDSVISLSGGGTTVTMIASVTEVATVVHESTVVERATVMRIESVMMVVSAVLSLSFAQVEMPVFVTVLSPMVFVVGK
jgi:hypothetical protein